MQRYSLFLSWAVDIKAFSQSVKIPLAASCSTIFISENSEKWKHFKLIRYKNKSNLHC